MPPKPQTSQSSSAIWGAKGIEQQEESFKLPTGDAPLVGDFVEQAHHRRDSGVELHLLDILTDLLDGLVERGFQLLRVSLPIGEDVLQAPDTLQEPFAALNGGGVPRGALLKIANEHLIEAHGIGAVFLDQCHRG